MNPTDNLSAALPSAPNVLTAAGMLDRAVEMTELRLDDGRVLRFPTSLLEEDRATATASTSSAFSAEPATAREGESEVIPLIEEKLTIGKRLVTTGAVRLRKSVQEFETSLDEPLAIRTYDIERIVLNQPIDTAPSIRHEGETTVYPLVEEQLILTKQLILKEEVRVTKRDTERRDTQTVVLRREHLEVERESR